MANKDKLDVDDIDEIFIRLPDLKAIYKEARNNVSAYKSEVMKGNALAQKPPGDDPKVMKIRESTRQKRERNKLIAEGKSVPEHLKKKVTNQVPICCYGSAADPNNLVRLDPGDHFAINCA